MVLLGLLTEAGRNYTERAHILFFGQIFDVAGAELRRHDKDGHIRGRQLLGIVIHLDALHLILLGIDDTERTLIVALQQVAHDGATWLVHIVGAADYDDALWFQ